MKTAVLIIVGVVIFAAIVLTGMILYTAKIEEDEMRFRRELMED